MRAAPTVTLFAEKVAEVLLLGAVVACGNETPSRAALRTPDSSPPAALSSAPLAPAPSSSAVAVERRAPSVQVLPKPIADSIVGCWKLSDSEERWRMTRATDGSVDVVREVAGPGPNSDDDYARRARIPKKLLYDPPQLAFAAAGPIHALLFTFKQVGDKLEVDSFSSRVPGAGYRATGNHFTVERCPTKTRP